MRDFATTIDIQAPPEEVWAVMSDVDRWSDWTPTVTSVVRKDKGRPLTVGSRATIKQPKFPPAVWKVTDVQRGSSFTWESGGPGFTVAGHHAIEASPAGSRVTLTLRFNGMLGGLWGWATRAINQRYIELEAQGLKTACEKRPAARKLIR